MTGYPNTVRAISTKLAGIDIGAFASDYSAARAGFLDACATARASRLEHYTSPVSGPKGEALAVDAAWFGPLDASRLIVIVSGTHGVEGFCGSAVQTDWLAIGGAEHPADSLAFLMIHAVNPYGFAWLRRVTEEGVDLNRNFVDFTEPLPRNADYLEITDALSPPTLSGPEFDACEAVLAEHRRIWGARKFERARSGGQYSHPDGLFFGGNAPTWSRRTLESIIAEFDVGQREQVAVIDIHTGWGPFGYGTVLCQLERGSAAHDRALGWYGSPPLLEVDHSDKDMPPHTGLIETAWITELGDRVVPATLEYGTFDRAADHRVFRDEHWLHGHTPVDWFDAKTLRIKKQIKDHFCPPREDWKEMVIFRGRQMIAQTVTGAIGARAR